MTNDGSARFTAVMVEPASRRSACTSGIPGTPCRCVSAMTSCRAARVLTNHCPSKPLAPVSSTGRVGSGVVVDGHDQRLGFLFQKDLAGSNVCIVHHPSVRSPSAYAAGSPRGPSLPRSY